MKSPPANHVHVYDKTKMLSDSQLQLLPQDLYRKLPFDTVEFPTVNTVVTYTAFVSNITFSNMDDFHNLKWKKMTKPKKK